MTVGSVTIDAKDYRGPGDFGLGSGATTHRGTPFDWLRMGWDLVTDEGDTVDAADPHTWRATDVGGEEKPSTRMSNAAQAVGGATLRSTWDANAASNGTDR